MSEKLNVGKPEDVKRHDANRTAKRLAELSDIRELMKLPVGRRFMYRLLADCGVQRSCVGDDEFKTYFYLGMRNVGLRLTNDILDSGEELYLKMLLENRAKSKEKKEEMSHE